MTDLETEDAPAGTIDSGATNPDGMNPDGANPDATAPDEGSEAPAAEGTADTDEAADAAEGGEEDEADGGSEAADEAGAASLPLASVVEALLFAAREPLKVPVLARAAGKGTKQEAVRDAVAELNLHYLETGRAFEIAEISGRLQLMSRPEYAGRIARLYPKKQGEADKATRLTPPALETLAVIAYKQPATRAEVERIRGCGCGPALRSLVERGSVRVAGKRTDLVGQPLLYATTEAFLAEFGLGSLDELPLRSEFVSPPPAGAELDGGEARVLHIISEPEAPEASEESTAPAVLEESVESPSPASPQAIDPDSGESGSADPEPEADPDPDPGPVLLPAAPVE